MPRFAAPDGDHPAADVVTAFGGTSRIDVIRHLRDNPGASITSTAAAIGAGRTTVFGIFADLERIGVVIGDTPVERRQRGAVSTFTLNAERVTELYARLGDEIGASLE
jgi:predicted transcriptional regulator